MEYGEELIKIVILENGRQVRLRDMEFIYGRMETSMKENGRIVLNMEWEQIFLQTGIHLQGTIFMGSLKVKVNINGAMEALM
jgi:hypothetical protein